MRPALLVLALAGCGDNDGFSYDHLVQLSGETPLLGCNVAAQTGRNFRSAEVEPSLAIDPSDPRHMVATWQQDRWSNGGANGIALATTRDGGTTWKSSLAPFTHCSNGDYDRTSDPWVAIGPDGTVYTVGLGFDATTDRSAVLVATGTTVTTLQLDDDPDVFNDKETVTAAPDGHVYAVWDRLTGLLQPTKPIGTGPTMMARLTDGTWEPARPIFDPGPDTQTIGNQLAVLPDGTLVVVMDVITMTSSSNPKVAISVIRSTDHGDSWSPPVTIAPVFANGVADPFTMRPVRTGAELAQIAADPQSGAVYVAWEAAVAQGRDGVVLSRSTDGGQSWSMPTEVNGAPMVDAFTPSLAAGAGTVGVFYYDLRDITSDRVFRATAWLATSTDGGGTWTDHRLTPGFAMASAVLGDAYFLGDYEGLVARDTDFVPLFGVAVLGNDPTDIFIRP